MDDWSTTSDVPGAPGTDHEERRSLALPHEDPTVAGPQKAGTATEKTTEEDWLATGDPAFWLK